MNHIIHIVIIIILNLGFINITIAQQARADSISVLLGRHAKNDTIRVNLLNELASELVDGDSELAIDYARKAMSIADSIFYNKGKAEAFNVLARTSYIKAEYTIALEYVHNSLGINKRIDNKHGIADNYAIIGTINHYLGDIVQTIAWSKKSLEMNLLLKDSVAICFAYATLCADYFEIATYDTALIYGLQALEMATIIDDQDAISYATNNVGGVYEVQGNLPKALDCFQQSYFIDEKLDNHRGASITASNIALILMMQDNYEAALTFCEKGVKHAELIGFKVGLNYNYENMGRIYKAQGNYEKAWENHFKTSEIHQEIGNQKGIAVSYCDIAELYVLTDSLNKAKNYYNWAIAISKEIAYKTIEVRGYIGLSEIAYKQNEFKLANKHSLHANSMAIETGNLELIQKSAEVLANSSNEIGKPQDAFDAYVLFKRMSDSLYNKDNVKNIANLEYKFKYQKEKELLEIEQQKKDKVLASELKKQKYVKNTFIGGFVLMMLFAIYIFRNAQKNKKLNQILYSKNKEIEHQAEELKTNNEALVKLSGFKEDMMNMLVHDLKNPLAVILNSNIIVDVTKRMGIIKQSGFTMINLIQNILDVYKYQSTKIALNKQSIDMNALVQTTIDKVKFLAQIKRIEFRISENRVQVNADNDILTRVITNILSNAVKFSPTDNVITIDYELIEGSQVKVSFHNNGPHIPESQQQYIFEKFNQLERKEQGGIKSTGLGLSFCTMAIKAHEGQLGVQSAINEGATFWFALPGGKLT